MAYRLRLQIFRAVPNVLLNLRRRALSSSSSDAPVMSPSEIERVKALSTSITSSVAEGVAEMKDVFGEHAVPLWMNDYYKHEKEAHKYIVPAISMICADPQAARLPSVSAKNAVFLASALSSLPKETASTYLSTVTMVAGVDIAFVMSVAALMRSDLGADMFRRLAASARRSGNRSLTEAAQRLAATPSVPVAEWADPLSDPAALHAHWEGRGAHATAAPKAFEVTPLFGAARDVLDFQDYLLLASTTVLEAQWAAFYATGSTAPLRRILSIGTHWADAGAHLPDAMGLLVSLKQPLPAELTQKSSEPEAAAAAVRLQIGRIALWSLLRQSRRHKAIPDALISACAEVTDHLVEPSARAEGRVITPWKEARLALEVFPALLHLMARQRIDAPFEETISGGDATTQ